MSNALLIILSRMVLKRFMSLKKATKLSAIMYYYNFFEQPFNLKILGGYTGTGKTEILHSLKKGQQVIDLEGLANHRGSAFGGIDLPPQPTTNNFKTICFL
jgi:tRNA 2-selenouridine synthase SelU